MNISLVFEMQYPTMLLFGGNLESENRECYNDMSIKWDEIRKLHLIIYNKSSNFLHLKNTF